MSLDAKAALRFWTKVDKTESCWLWTDYLNKWGYGQFALRENGHRTTLRAHRVAYELLVGPIPPGLTLDHLCRNPACVNPAHLEPTTIQENLARGEGVCALNAAKTRCVNGHEFTPENTYVRPTGRMCRECGREASRAYHRRRRLQLVA